MPEKPSTGENQKSSSNALWDAVDGVLDTVAETLIGDEGKKSPKNKSKLKGATWRESKIASLWAMSCERTQHKVYTGKTRAIEMKKYKWCREKKRMSRQLKGLFDPSSELFANLRGKDKKKILELSQDSMNYCLKLAETLYGCSPEEIIYLLVMENLFNDVKWLVYLVLILSLAETGDQDFFVESSFQKYLRTIPSHEKLKDNIPDEEHMRIEELDELLISIARIVLKFISVDDELKSKYNKSWSPEKRIPTILEDVINRLDSWDKHVDIRKKRSAKLLVIKELFEFLQTSHKMHWCAKERISYFENYFLFRLKEPWVIEWHTQQEAGCLTDIIYRECQKDVKPPHTLTKKLTSKSYFTHLNTLQTKLADLNWKISILENNTTDLTFQIEKLRWSQERNSTQEKITTASIISEKEGKIDENDEKISEYTEQIEWIENKIELCLAEERQFLESLPIGTFHRMVDLSRKVIDSVVKREEMSDSLKDFYDIAKPVETIQESMATAMEKILENKEPWATWIKKYFYDLVDYCFGNFSKQKERKIAEEEELIPMFTREIQFWKKQYFRKWDIQGVLENFSQSTQIENVEPFINKRTVTTTIRESMDCLDAVKELDKTLQADYDKVLDIGTAEKSLNSIYTTQMKDFFWRDFFHADKKEGNPSFAEYFKKATIALFDNVREGKEFDEAVLHWKTTYHYNTYKFWKDTEKRFEVYEESMHFVYWEHCVVFWLLVPYQVGHKISELDSQVQPWQLRSIWKWDFEKLSSFWLKVYHKWSDESQESWDTFHFTPWKTEEWAKDLSAPTSKKIHLSEWKRLTDITVDLSEQVIDWLIAQFHRTDDETFFWPAVQETVKYLEVLKTFKQEKSEETKKDKKSKTNKHFVWKDWRLVVFE